MCLAVFEWCVCVWAGILFITSILTISHIGLGTRGNTTGAEALDTNYAARKKNKKNRCFSRLFDQSFHVVFTEQYNYPEKLSMYAAYERCVEFACLVISCALSVKVISRSRSRIAYTPRVTCRLKELSKSSACKSIWKQTEYLLCQSVNQSLSLCCLLSND